LEYDCYSSKFINILTTGIEMASSISYLNNLIEKVFQDHANKSKIINISKINIEKENIIHIVKRIIDDIIIILCIKNDNEYFLAHNKIRFSSIGEIDKNQSELAKMIKQDLNYDKYRNILTTINDLHNSYKHSCLLNASRMNFAVEGVAFFSFYSPYGNLNNVFYLRHNLLHIVVGISDFLLDFFNVESVDRKHELIITERTIKI